MKKIISILSVTLVIIFCLGVVSFASGEVTLPTKNTEFVTLSDDLQELYYNDKTYSRINGSLINYDMFYDDEYYVEYEIDSSSIPPIIEEELRVKLNDKQKLQIDDVLCSANETENIIDIEVYYKDGATLCTTFMRNDCVDEYNKIISGESDGYSIDFMWPDGNIVSTTKDKLFSEKKTEIKFGAWEYPDAYDVVANSKDKSFSIDIGTIILKDDVFYYFDFKENDITDYFDSVLFEDGEKTISVYEITDPELITALEEAYQKYLEDDYGFLFDEDLSESVSKVFFVIIFAVIPFAIFVASVILALRSKKKIYRKIFAAISVLTLAEVITFIVTAIILFKK